MKKTMTGCIDRMKRSRVFVIGPIPPPVYGLAAVNGKVMEQLCELDSNLRVINLAAPSLHRDLFTRFKRFSRVVQGIWEFAMERGVRRQVLYMSVSGGLGQIYEILFLFMARRRQMQIVLHHHSYAYLDAHNFITQILINTAGASCVHVVLSLHMADLLKERYGATQVVAISSATFILNSVIPAFSLRQRPITLGFISNITAEKGIFDFLELMTEIQTRQLPFVAKIAGPFQDTQTRDQVTTLLENLHNSEYVGPKYGNDKDNFFADIDVLVFPTRYRNEAEPSVIHEAMSRGIPVIAYGRGSIPEVIDSSCGLVVSPEKEFVPEALAQMRAWMDSPDAFQRASAVAAERFSSLYADSLARWEVLKANMIRGSLKHQEST